MGRGPGAARHGSSEGPLTRTFRGPNNSKNPSSRAVRWRFCCAPASSIRHFLWPSRLQSDARPLLIPAPFRSGRIIRSLWPTPLVQLKLSEPLSSVLDLVTARRYCVAEATDERLFIPIHRIGALAHWNAHLRVDIQWRRGS